MKKILLSVLLLSSVPAFSKTINYKKYYNNSVGCFILYDVNKNKTITEYKTELCSKPTPPNSTFKIPLSIMGFDKNLLTDASHPSWEFKKEYLRNGVQEWMPKQWQENVTPKLWLQYSVVWYSERLVEKIGLDEINTYLEKFSYGNKNFNGLTSDKEKLLIPWIDSSLEITAYQQLEFMKKFLKNELPVAKHAIEKTKEILQLEHNDTKSRLYGKSGAGYLENRIAHGWFIGWLEKDNKQYIFISQIKDKSSHGKMNSVIAKKNAFEFLKQLGYL